MKHKTLFLIGIAILGIGAISFGQTVPSYVPTNGLVGWWQFSENANDYSANANHGSIYGALLCPDRFGHDSSAFYFDGNNEQIQISNDTMLTNHMDLTASAWFRVENRPSGWDQNIIMANIGNYYASGGFELFTSNPPSAHITGMFRNPTFADQEILTTGLVNIDNSQWYHVVYILEYFSSLDSTKASIYLNDTLIKVQYFLHSISYSGITPFIVGANIDSLGYQRNFKGRIDDIGLWNRALSQSEITGLYNAVTTGVTETTNEKYVKIYPNPATYQINVEVDASIIGSTYYISDQLGRIVSSGKLISEKSIIEFSELSGGIYLFKVGNNTKQTFKVIKQ